ncbi:MAG: fasciclin domain-containing protein, partial [Flavobacterium sp.]|nr:fasciclin domain-containing protein [Flavobacterium sp.]
TDVPVPILKGIMLNHFMLGLQKSTNLYTGYFSTLAIGTASASNNLSLYVSSTSNIIVLNGTAKIITPDIIASNGVIHVIDHVLILPTILSQLTANANFTDLLLALTLQNQSLPLNYFKNTLSDANTKTFFAPTNAAFSSFNTEFGYTATNPISALVQNQILRYHIAIGTNYFFNSFVNNQIIGTNQGTNLLIQLSVNSFENYVKLQDANGRQASISYKNIQCSNGIIHVIDKVLKP